MISPNCSIGCRCKQHFSGSKKPVPFILVIRITDEVPGIDYKGDIGFTRDPVRNDPVPFELGEIGGLFPRVAIDNE